MATEPKRNEPEIKPPRPDLQPSGSPPRSRRTRTRPREMCLQPSLDDQRRYLVVLNYSVRAAG
jgi:hypothetical protein